MMEAEAKYRIKDPSFVDKIVKILLGNGFKHEGVFREEDTYYNHPCRDLKVTDEALRLRTRVGEGPATHRLTYKGPRKYTGSIKIREEYEVEISDPEVVNTILIKLGFKPVAKVVKERTIYRKNKCEATIDKLLGLEASFIELECDKNSIMEISGLLEEMIIPEHKTYLEIIMEEGSG